MVERRQTEFLVLFLHSLKIFRGKFQIMYLRSFGGC
nr:MAG TPA: hypothetical protein [Caudoviricetes sp.]